MPVTAALRKRYRMTNAASARIVQVCKRIEADLAAPWRTATLARVAGMAQHHFQRQFAAFTGETVAGYIRSRRLERAAILLRDTDDRVLDIALETGFQTHAALTRAFSSQFGSSPRQFRKTGKLPRQSKLPARPYLLPLSSRSLLVDWDEVEVPERWLCARVTKGVRDGRFFGDLNSVHQEFSDLHREVEGKAAILCTAFVDAPAGFQDLNARAYYGALLSERQHLVWSTSWKKLDAGTYAVFPHFGPFAALHLTWNRCVRAGFEQLGIAYRPGWCFETYVTTNPESPPHDLSALLYLPITKGTIGEIRQS